MDHLLLLGESNSCMEYNMLYSSHSSFPLPHRRHFCPHCGASLRDDEKCDALFEKVLEREYSNPEYGAVHLLTVDCYALQHSEIHSPRSNAFHLLRLSFILHYGSLPAIGFQDKRLDALVKRKYRDFPDLRAPYDRGNVTVANVIEAINPQEHRHLVMQWAQAVWDAYGAYHQWVNEMIEAQDI